LTVSNVRTLTTALLSVPSLPFVLAFLPKVHDGTDTLWALDLLCGVSKQPVADFLRRATCVH
jgi:hypothetical protein